MSKDTGIISVGNFRAVLESLQESQDQAYPHLDQLLNEISDRPDDDTLDFDAFLGIMESTSLQQTLAPGADEKSNFEHVFNLFDGE